MRRTDKQNFGVWKSIVGWQLVCNCHGESHWTRSADEKKALRIHVGHVVMCYKQGRNRSIKCFARIHSIIPVLNVRQRRKFYFIYLYIQGERYDGIKQNRQRSLLSKIMTFFVMFLFSLCQRHKSIRNYSYRSITSFYRREHLMIAMIVMFF